MLGNNNLFKKSSLIIQFKNLTKIKSNQLLFIILICNKLMNQNPTNPTIQDTDRAELRQPLNNQVYEMRKVAQVIQSQPKYEEMVKAKAQIVTTYKSFWNLLFIAVTLSMSSFYAGYTFCQISTVSITVLKQTFNISLSPGTTRGLLVGIVPIGGIIGSFINPLLVRFFSRKNVHVVICIVNISYMVLVQITNFPCIMVGRFILGMCGSAYTMIGPQYTRQITPPPLRPVFGTLFSLTRIGGIMFAYLLGLIFEVADVNQYWRIIFIIPGALSIVQTIMILIYLPASPVQLAESKNQQQLRKVIARLYKQEFVQVIVQQHIKQCAMQKSRSNSEAKDPLKGNKNRALGMALHLHSYRQFIGINTVVAFEGVILQTVNKGFSLYANLLLTGVQFVATFVATVYVGKKFGRRPLYLISGVLIAISCYLIAIGFLVDVKIMIIVFLFIYNIVFGLIFSPVSWAYPFQIVPANKSVIGNAFTWIALTITALVPPIVIQKMDGNAWAVFMFFGGYTTLSLIYMWFQLIQTKGRPYQEFIHEF